jgi:WD40 repeat protein
MAAMNIYCRALALAFAVLLQPSSALRSAEPTYWQDVRPIMRKNCTVCHSQKTLREPDVSAGLALDTYEAILKGGEAPVVKKGNGADSQLVKILRHPKPSRRMPLDADPLPDETVALLKRWIDAGALEGARPAETEPAAVVTTPGKTRKLDVVLAKVPLPKALGPTGNLELLLPIGPLAPITAVVFSPNGKQLVCGCYGRAVVWDLTTGAPAKALTNVLGAVNDVRFSPDGKTLAVAGGQPSARGDIRLYSTNDWKLLATLGGHLDVVSSISFRPDGKQLASASFDKTVRVWDLETRQTILQFTGHSDFVHAVAFGPKGDWFVTASKDRTGRLIDARTGRSILTFSGMELDVLTAAVNPSGDEVVTSGFEPALHFWSTKTGERLRRLGGHSLATHELAYSDNGSVLASAGADKTVRTWNPKTGELLKSLTVGSMVYAVAVRADGKLIASGSFDGLVRIWEPDASRLVVTLLSASVNDWLALTPELFGEGSDAIVKMSRWRNGRQALPGDPIWKAVRQPKEVARALNLQKLGEPAFPIPPK